MCICSNCFGLLRRIQKFSERCNKAHHFLQYLKSLPDPAEDFKVLEVRKQFGLESEFKADRSTDTVDLQLDIKSESFDQSQVEALECDDHSFDELEDFGEISTIALPDESNFVVSGDVIEPEEDNDIKEQSCDETKAKKDDDEVLLQ